MENIGQFFRKLRFCLLDAFAPSLDFFFRLHAGDIMINIMIRSFHIIFKNMFLFTCYVSFIYFFFYFEEHRNKCEQEQASRHKRHLC